MKHPAQRSIAAVVAVFSALAFLGATPLRAQCLGLWAQADLGPQSGHVMVYDSLRSRVVLHCASPSDGTAAGTWAWNGASWSRLAFDGPFPARSGFALAYDSARDRLVLFGGTDSAGNLLGDTWEFDGAFWRLIATEGPPARHSAGMVYNTARGTTELFGGSVPGPSGDHWEWDGWSWRSMTLPGPPASAGPPMVYDSARARTIVLSGGTWELAQTGWVLATLQEPPWQSAHAIVYDRARARVVVFGGDPGCRATDPGETWEYNNAAWVRRTPAASPAARSFEAMAYDEVSHTALMFGGRTVGGFDCGQILHFDDTWAWNGAAWTRVSRPRPDPRNYTSQVFDTARGRFVLFGGFVTQCGLVGCLSYLNDTWLWDTAAWTRVTSPQNPDARNLHAAAFDALRSRTILFGGAAQIARFDDTWSFDNIWTRVATTGPGFRTEHARGYDPARDRVLLFGGTGAGPAPTTTWEWDGSQWINVTPDGASPDPRSASAMAFDPVRGAMILFGGGSLISGVFLADTWEWKGQAWSLLPVAGPPGRQGHAMSTDPQRAVIMMTGGGSSAGAAADTWEWNGAAWTRVGAGGPSNAGQTMAYDSVRGATYMRSFNASWEWHGPTAPTIVIQPASTVGLIGRRTVFTCVPSGPGPLFIEWLRDGIVLQDDGRIRGATTTRLVLEQTLASDAGFYDVRVTNACGVTDSKTVTLTVFCVADYNQDGAVNQLDHDQFLGEWNPADPGADLNGDGFLDGIDYDTFMNAYEAGC